MNRTEEAIIDAFWELLEKKTYSKITVKDIVELCQVNRNTFYYHFQDIPELLERVIKKAADEIIKNSGKFDAPVDCLIPMINAILEKKTAFLHIYHSVQRDVFLNELNMLTLYCVNDYVDTVTKDLSISTEDKKLLVRFYKCALVGITLDWLDHNMDYDILDSTKRISYLFRGTIKNAFFQSAQTVE